MLKFKHLSLFSTSLIATSMSLSAIAETSSTTANSIFNAAESQFGQYFDSSLGTLAFPPDWPYYRGPYPSGTFVGINTGDDVYVLGGAFGNSPVFIDSVDGVVRLLGISDGNTGGDKAVCAEDDIPEGFSYTQEGNIVTISTNGKCVVLPDDNSDYSCEIPSESATGIHVLTSVEIASFELTGLIVNIPGFNFADQLNDSFSATTCTINAHESFSSLTVNMDICLDVTSQFDSFSDIPGITVSSPVTYDVVGSSKLEVINDCFSSGASVINDAFSGETWIKDVITNQYNKIN